MTSEAQAAPGRPQAPRLLLTKLHSPGVPAQVVVRDRLFERLDDGRGRRLSLVACPAGFGKSTLLGAWQQSRDAERPVAWLTVDESDDDAVVLWSHLIEALARVCPGVRDADLMPPRRERGPAHPRRWADRAHRSGWVATADRPDVRRPRP